MVGEVVATKVKKKGFDRTGRHDASQRIGGFLVPLNIVTIRAFSTSTTVEYVFAIIGCTRFIVVI
jgi:hypothetical protein